MAWNVQFERKQFYMTQIIVLKSILPGANRRAVRLECLLYCCNLLWLYPDIYGEFIVNGMFWDFCFITSRVKRDKQRCWSDRWGNKTIAAFLSLVSVISHTSFFWQNFLNFLVKIKWITYESRRPYVSPNSVQIVLDLNFVISYT